MKTSNGGSMVRRILGFGLLFATMAGVAHAQQGGRLTGTWDIALTVRNCDTKVPIVTLRELATFNQGGTMVSSTSIFPQATKTPGHGVWRRVVGPDGPVYEYRFKFFRFDAAGAFVGWTIVHQAASIVPTGDQYQAEGGAESYNTARTLISSGCSTTEATRFE